MTFFSPSLTAPHLTAAPSRWPGTRFYLSKLPTTAWLFSLLPAFVLVPLLDTASIPLCPNSRQTSYLSNQEAFPTKVSFNFH